MFISLEGIDGSGKTTQARLLADRLTARGVPTLLLREPGGTPLSERIRAILLDPALSIEPFAELLLFSAARSQLVAEKIVPSTAAGVTVITDRFFDSTTAYQGGGRGLVHLDWLRAFHLRVTGGLVPDVTYYLAVDLDRAAGRRGLRHSDESQHHQAEDRMEQAGLEFQRLVAEAYEQIADEEPVRIVRINGDADPEIVHQQIWDDLRTRLALRAET